MHRCLPACLAVQSIPKFDNIDRLVYSALTHSPTFQKGKISIAKFCNEVKFRENGMQLAGNCERPRARDSLLARDVLPNINKQGCLIHAHFNLVYSVKRIVI